MTNKTYFTTLLGSFRNITMSCLCLMGTFAAGANGVTIQAENFTSMSGIQTETTQDIGGGINIGFIDAGDWMAYPVNIPGAGQYTVSYRVASLNGGGLLQFEQQGGSPVYGSINVTGTGGWQSWVTISHVVTLPAGQQNIALAAKTGGFNINWFSIEPVTPLSSSSSSLSERSSSSVSSSAMPILGITLQAESFTQMKGVQTENTQDAGGGLNVGWTDTGDWMTYASVDLPCSGAYTVEYRVASGTNGGSLKLEKAGGSQAFGNLNIGGTGGWQAWKTLSHDVVLPAGSMNFGIAVTQGGWNLNWIRIIPKCFVTPSSSSSFSSSSSSFSSSSSSSQANRAPIANLRVSPIKHSCSSFSMNISASGSIDPDGDPLTYKWIVNGQAVDNTQESFTVPLPAALAVFDFIFPVTLTVTDGKGGSHQVTSNQMHFGFHECMSSSSSSVRSSSSSSSSSSSIDPNHYDAPKVVIAPVIDGVADAVWNLAPWAPIDVFWLGSQQPSAQDFNGRYKAMWDAGNLYLLFDINDDVLLDATSNPLERFWDDDCVEIFIDENRSGGNHNGNTNAWAYHIALNGDVVDSTFAGAKLLNSHVTVRRVTNGTKHLWEMSMRVYGDNFNDNAVNTPVALFPGKLMGFSAAYNDNDFSSQRESMIGSVNTQGHKDNLGFQNASVFGSMRLIDNNQSSSKSSSSSVPSTPTTVVLQAEDYVRATDVTPGNTGGAYRQGDTDIEATTDVGSGFNVGWTEANETLTFDTNLVEGTSYEVYARVASKTSGNFQYQSGKNQPIFVTVPNTGDYQAWQTIKVGDVFVFGGGVSNGVTISVVNGGFNLNWIKLIPNCLNNPSCIDGDKDGVSDEIDECPNTLLGAVVNEKGCVLKAAITAKAAAQAMGKGFNIGQMFENTQHAPTFANAKAKIDAYYAKGFRNVRIPITWTENVQGSTLVNDPNIGDVNMNHPRLAIIKQVVDYALAKPDMYVVINAHHESALKNGNKAAVLERLWQDISSIFVDRDYRLVYEFLNEPHLDNANKDPMDPANLRNMTSKAYTKVRAKDPQRIVIIGGNQWFAAHEMAITWPHLNDVGGGQDKFMMAEFHHYNPWTFNGDNQGDYADNWNDGNVTGPMDTMANWANSVGQGMPVYIGEWGTGWGSRYSTMQCNNIRLFYKTLGWQFAPAKGQPTALWDDGGWFKVFDHGTSSFANNLVDCINGNCAWDGAERFNAGCN